MSFKIDGRDVDKLADDVSGIEDAVSRAEYRAVNKVAEKTLTNAKRQMAGIVNLRASYISDKMKLIPARMNYPVAVIEGRDRPTRLATYGYTQVTVAAPKSKGNPTIGIPAGRKAAGIRAGVKAGTARPLMPGAFLMPLQNGNGLGIFTRPAPGARARHRYGPSVDQTFGLVVKDVEPTIPDALDEMFNAQLTYEMKNL